MVIIIILILQMKKLRPLEVVICHLHFEEQAEVFVGRMKEKQDGSELWTQVVVIWTTFPSDTKILLIITLTNDERAIYALEVLNLIYCVESYGKQRFITDATLWN